MAAYNQLTIVGNVGKDPAMRYTKDGVPVCDFSVAVNEKRGGEETTLWVRVTCWRQLAEIANQYVRKGAPVMVAGRANVSAYTNKAGQPAASLELTADNLVLLGSRADTGAGGDDFLPPPDNVSEIPF